MSYYQNYLGQAFFVFFNYLQQSIRDPFITKRNTFEYYKTPLLLLLFKCEIISIYHFFRVTMSFTPGSNEDKNCFQEIPFVLFVPGLIVAQTVVNHSKTFAITYSSRNYVIKAFL